MWEEFLRVLLRPSADWMRPTHITICFTSRVNLLVNLYVNLHVSHVNFLHVTCFT